VPNIDLQPRGRCATTGTCYRRLSLIPLQEAECPPARTTVEQNTNLNFCVSLGIHAEMTSTLNAILHGENSTAEPMWYPNPTVRGTWSIYQTCVIGEFWNEDKRTTTCERLTDSVCHVPLSRLSSGIYCSWLSHISNCVSYQAHTRSAVIQLGLSVVASTVHSRKLATSLSSHVAPRKTMVAFLAHLLSLSR